jgi:NAD(P)-dependent dehydrogenase (short-subunit alcohol dehydrogenase family)
MSDLFRLDGRLAIVTGASRGLGAAMAIGLAEAGADVAVAGGRASEANRPPEIRHEFSSTLAGVA